MINAALSDYPDARAYRTDIHLNAGNLRILAERSLDIHGNKIDKSFINRGLQAFRQTAVCIELYWKTQAPDPRKKIQQVSMQQRFASAYHNTVQTSNTGFQK